jgi:hypothetical protein
MTMMYKSGTIRTKAQSWQDMYFPEAQQRSRGIEAAGCG